MSNLVACVAVLVSVICSDAKLTKEDFKYYFDKADLVDPQKNMEQLYEKSQRIRKLVRSVRDKPAPMNSDNWRIMLPMLRHFLSKDSMAPTARNTAEILEIQMRQSGTIAPVKEVATLLVPWLDSPDSSTLKAVTRALGETIKHLSKDDAHELIRNLVIPKLREVVMTARYYPLENSLKMIKALVETNCNYAQSVVNEQLVQKLKESSELIEKSEYTKNIPIASSEVADAILKCNDPDLQQYRAGLNDLVRNTKELKFDFDRPTTTVENENKKKHEHKIRFCSLFDFKCWGNK